MRLAQRLESSAGFGIIEVLVTALVVMIVAGAALAGLDAASRASGRTKARSIAMTLAQSDQERLRAMPIADLANVRSSNTRTANVCDAGGGNCVTYTIASQADWVSDSSGLESCTTPNAGFDYLKITSTVTWPSLNGGTPVTTQSMVTPVIGAVDGAVGNLAVKVVRADGVTGVPDVRVNLSGPKNLTAKTNSAGCVVWGALPAGNGYTVAVDEPGFVGVQGKQALSRPAGVVQDSLSTTTLLYDGAASAQIGFYSVIGGVEWSDQKVDQVTLAQSQMQPVTRFFGQAGTPTQTLALTSLFPFSSKSVNGPYRIYAGACASGDPLQQSPADPAVKSLPDLTPGNALTGGYRLQIPALDFTVTVNGTPSATAKTKIVPVTPGCDNPDADEVSKVPVVATAPNVGRPAQPGYPYGIYDVCAEAQVGSVTKHLTKPGVALKALPSATVGTLNLTSSSLDGGC